MLAHHAVIMLAVHGGSLNVLPCWHAGLNAASLDAWRHKYGQLVRPCGTLILDDPSPTSPDSTYPCQQLSTHEQLVAHEPHILNLLPHAADSLTTSTGAVASSLEQQQQQYKYSTAHVYRQELWVDPVQAVHAMLEEAQAHGAVVVPGEVVQQLVIRDQISASPSTLSAERPQSQHASIHSPRRVLGAVTASGKQYTADAVVLAAGTVTPKLAAPAGVHVPLLHKPVSVAITNAQPPDTLRGMLYAHGTFAVQRPDGTLMLGGTEGVDLQGRDAAAARWLAVMRALISPKLHILSLHTAHLPWPHDGWPIVGSCAAPRLAHGRQGTAAGAATPSAEELQSSGSQDSRSSKSSFTHDDHVTAADGQSTGCDGLYVCVTHSGLTLAPLLGQLLAEEICSDLRSGGGLGGLHDAWLGMWRPGRDYTAAAAGGDVAYSLWHPQERPSGRR